MDGYPLGRSKWELDTPVLCVDADRLERNIARMGAYFEARVAKLRPHSKTHKCPVIGWMQIRAGAIGLTCAKLNEAEAMARAGIRDLLIANEVVGADKIARLVSLASYSDVMVAVDDLQNAQELSAAANAKGLRVRVLMEVDIGMHRCGVLPGDASLSLARQLVKLPGVRLEGLFGYEGHTVMIPGMDQRRRAAEEALGQLVGVRGQLERDGIPVHIVSAGGTGTYEITGNYAGITEVEAGSYVTMDGRYQEAGADFELALTAVARAMSVSGADRAIIDAGHKTLTSEFGTPRLLRPDGWKLDRLAEEHAWLRREGGAPLHRGDRVEILPSHGCTTINLHDALWVTRKDVLEAVWPVSARGGIR